MNVRWGATVVAICFVGAVCAPASGRPETLQRAVPRATCGPGSRPETALQGEVSIADRTSGRSAAGYTCNLRLVASYGRRDGFEGASWQLAWYKRCAYYNTKLGGGEQRPGTIVIDARDPRHPKFSTNLTTPAMLDPWESLKVNQRRGLLGGVFIAGYFDVYDLTSDCARPHLTASVPVDALGHEGSWAPDGKTYYSTGYTVGVVTAIDVTDPSAPKTIATFSPNTVIHGFGVSDDGNRMYLAHVNTDYVQPVLTGGQSLTRDNGLGVYDISQIQRRVPDPHVRMVGKVTWTDGSIGQHALPFTSHGRRFVAFADEFSFGGPRIIDVKNEAHPRVVTKLKLEIQLPQYRDRARAETLRPAGGESGGGGGVLRGDYNSHYCNIDQTHNPTILACSTFQSGLRVFDIRNPWHPREVAYFNPGGDGHQMSGSFGGTYSGYTSAQPRILADRGEIWFTDQDRGFMIVRFINGMWPLRAGAAT